MKAWLLLTMACYWRSLELQVCKAILSNLFTKFDLEGLESLSEVSSKYTERSSVAIRGNTTSLPDFLPPQREWDKGKKTLVLDLDETLVHSSFHPPKHGERPPNMILNVQWDNGERDYVFVKIRPHWFAFLIKMSKIYEVIIFTASILNYAQPLVNKLDKKKYGFQILSRRQCTLMNNWYYKDLSRLGRDMRNVVMVDNSPQAFAWQPENGLPIISWFEDTRGIEILINTLFYSFLRISINTLLNR